MSLCPGISLLASYILACVFIVKAITMNFSEDWDVGIFYLSNKFELDRFTYNGDLLADRILWKRTQSHTHTHTHRPTLILSTTHTRTNAPTHTHPHTQSNKGWKELQSPRMYRKLLICAASFKKKWQMVQWWTRFRAATVHHFGGSLVGN